MKKEQLKNKGQPIISKVKSYTAPVNKKLLLYKKIFEKVNAFVFVLDIVNKKFLWINENHKSILGYKINKKVHDKSVFDELFHPDDRDIICEMRTFFNSKKKGIFTSIYRLRNADNQYFWVFTNAKVFNHKKETNTLEVIGITVDFSIDIQYNKHLKSVFRDKLKKCNKNEISKISPRELEVIKFFANGYKTKEIAQKLEISFHTVNNHRKNILRKLELRNLSAMVSFAVENGLN